MPQQHGSAAQSEVYAKLANALPAATLSRGNWPPPINFALIAHAQEHPDSRSFSTDGKIIAGEIPFNSRTRG